MFSSIRWRIALPYVLLILLSMGALTGYLAALVRDTYLDNQRDQLLSEARLMADALGPALADDHLSEDLDAQVKRYSDLLGTRVTIIGTDGIVLGESHEDRTKMDNHSNRPEVQEARAQGYGSSTRYSATIGYEMMYVAVPTVVDGEIAGIVRVALPLQDIETRVARLRRTTLMAALITALLAALIAERIARPVRRLTRVAERMAEGHLGERLLPTSRDEIGMLTCSLNTTAERLRHTITTLGEERSRLEAILENMADGVLITDGDGQVQLINPTAARPLNTTQEEALGKSFSQVAREHRLIEFWEKRRYHPDDGAEVIEIDRQQRFLQVIVTPFQEQDASSHLIIVQDLTAIRRLETVRRDFISNISHELRTPLAGLRALVDTLRDGALDDPPPAQRFLNRIETEVDSMTQMVQELLELSRIESGLVPVQLSPTDITHVVAHSAERLRPQADRADLQLDIDLPSRLPQVLADPDRILQVVTNLVHNAIKFTPAGG